MNGHLAEKRPDRKSKGAIGKNERGDRKGESSDSPEIPERRTHQTSRPPSRDQSISNEIMS